MCDFLPADRSTNTTFILEVSPARTAGVCVHVSDGTLLNQPTVRLFVGINVSERVKVRNKKSTEGPDRLKLHGSSYLLI